MSTKAEVVTNHSKHNEDISIQANPLLFDSNGGDESNDDDDLTFDLKPRKSPEEYALMDPYEEDDAEQKLLAAKPTCFLIVGKPGSGKTTIAKKLAMEWKAEFVNSTELILQNIEHQTELGRNAQEMLLRGEAIPPSMVAQMIDNKVNSSEVVHHGYVVDGFPTHSEDGLDINTQMNILNNWKLQPDFIVNLRIPDEDLLGRRLTQKVDPYSGVTYIKEVYQPERVVVQENKATEEEQEEEEAQEEDKIDSLEEETKEQRDEFFAELPPDVIERLVVRPEDLEQNVVDSIKSFKDAALRVLEDKMANMDQSYLIELDANVSPTILIKQLLERLSTFHIRKAAKVLRLSDAKDVPEEEGAAGGMSDSIETEEMIQSLVVQKRLSPKFKWRRSRWLRYCPVHLKNGALVEGRPEYAAAFLDKVYVMANEQSLRKFMKNPRDYLRVPNPKIPCKLAIIGGIHSGKSSLAKMLARKYNAKVLEVNHLIEPKMKVAREEVYERAKQEAIKKSMESLKIKAREMIALEKIRREQMELSQLTLTDKDPNEGTMGTIGEGMEIEKDKAAETIKTDEALTQDSQVESGSKFYTVTPDGEITIDIDHPEISKAVEKAIEEISKDMITLPASDYISVIEEEIKKIQKDKELNDPTAASEGGWILDDFPQTTDQLHEMIEANLIPDTFVVLQDNSDSHYILTKRWYQHNKDDIDQRVYSRLEHDKQRREEEREKTEKLPRENSVEANKDEADKDKGAGAEGDDEGKKEALKRNETLEKIPEEDEPRDARHEDDPYDQYTFTSNGDIGTNDNEYFPTKGPEVEEFIQFVKEANEKLRSIQNSIVTVTGNEAILIEINRGPSVGVDLTHRVDCKTQEEIYEEGASAIEKVFKYKPIEFEGLEDQEPEEEEGQEEEEIEDEENEEEEGDPTSKDSKIQFGETSHYCPVALSTKFMLVPGNPDIQCKYREKIFRFFTELARQSFMDNPDRFLSLKRPIRVPPPRILILGPRGSGKTTQARPLAQRLDVFHIKFRDRLQELIIGKTKKPVGPEFEEDKSDDEDGDLSDEKKLVNPSSSGFDLTESEEQIKNYLEKDEALPNEILDTVIGTLWNEEPYRSRGFVLEGFPSTDNEASYLVEKGFFPEVVAILSVTDDAIIERLLPPRLERWRHRMATKKEKREQEREAKRKEIEEKMQHRRLELTYEREQLRIKREAAGEEVEEEEEDIEALVLEEFQDDLQEEEVEDEQSEDEAKENMVSDVRANYETQTSFIDSIKEIFQEVFVPRFTVDGNRKENIVRFLLNKKLQKYIEERESLFERAFVIKHATATKLIEFGYKQLSRFGIWCPVRLFHGDTFPPIYDEHNKGCPVIYRSYIYYLSSKEARDKFMKNPLTYLKQPSPLQITPLKISIVGPPKSGKTTLAKRLCKEYGCMRLSLGEAIRMVLEKQANTDLAKRIKSFLYKGKTVPDDLSIQCLEVAMLDVKCQIRGYVLDGFPITKNHVKYMTERSIIPVKIIELKCDMKEMFQRCLRDRSNPELKKSNIILHDSPEIIGHKLREWKSHVVSPRKWYTNEHKNWVEIDGQLSKWLIWDRVKRIANESVKHIQAYIYRISKGRAASIANMCVTYDEMVNRLGDFGQYCPVSLALNDELVDCSSNRTMSYVAEYNGYYYKMFSELELHEFLRNPERFVPPNAPRKLPPPEFLPLKRTAAEVKETLTKRIELNGYCPVTYFDGKQRYEALEHGNLDFTVEYKEKLYTMADADAQDKFMRTPQKYANIKLPHKLPPVREPMNVLNLPMLGYLEQTVSTILVNALHSVGTFKPKFPFISPTRSALLYLAYYLKAYNHKSSEYRRKKYKQKLLYFEDSCQLIHYLGTKTTLRYKETSKQTPEFKEKYESFFALQQNVPTMNWLA